jgi:multicomponent Na+:H+ antiporter subunit A
MLDPAHISAPGLPVLLVAAVGGFAIAALIPWLRRLLGEQSTLVAALFPVAITAWLVSQAPQVFSGQAVEFRIPWIDGLGLDLALRLDGLSLLFGLLIAGIGTLVVLYTRGYLHDDPGQHRFVMFTLMFMSSMLGVVFSENVLLLFIFWELTSFTSYLMIGYHHDQEASRKAALQALLVTGAGGLFLLAGLILAGQAAGSFDLTGIIAGRDLIVASPQFSWILGLILVGAFTKSAQVPFHFWLPNAMQAPTPASAYLHSSTMVKAGVYLLARLHPAFGSTEPWQWAVTGFGAATLLTGALMASGQVYLKRLLAYTTVGALGAMVMGLGIGTDTALKAVAAFLLAHAAYKAALFLVAGIIDHETGEKNVTKLGGLIQAMPRTGTAALVAAASMAGLPFTFGFIGKELFYTDLASRPAFAAVFFIAGACFMLVAWQTGIRPFFAAATETPKSPHEAPWSMTAGPLLLGLVSLTLGIVPGLADGLVGAAASAMRGQPLEIHLHVWHGLNLPLLLSALTLAAGAAMIATASGWRSVAEALAPAARFGPDRLYDAKLKGLVAFAGWQTRFLQNGSLRRYLLVTVMTLCALVVVSFARADTILAFRGFSPVSLPMALLSVLVILSAIAATLSTSRLGAVAAMGVVGFSVALYFIFFGAPDLAMTQLVVETLSVVLLVSAFYYLPPFAKRSTWRGRARDLTVSVFAGAVVTLLVLVASGIQLREPISSYYAETSVPIGHGRNIVNVILVDYRGLDTLGEITVLAVAGLGSLALLKLRAKSGGKP